MNVRQIVFRAVLVVAVLVVAMTAQLAVLVEAVQAQAGEQIFNTTCTPCHTIGGGRLVGPDLQGVTERRTAEWMARFIKSSQSVVRSGDETAVALFEEFNRMPMPDQSLSDAQIADVIAFLGSGGAASAGGGDAGDGMAIPDRPATEEDIARGQDLFQGLIRLENRGPACNSCHHVENDAVIGGGVLAKDLTAVFGRMGGSGVGAILGQPPFPVMQAAYDGRALTGEEKFALIAFLEYADAQQAFQTPRDFGMNLFVSGFGGFVGLMILFSLIWMRRKKRSVNEDIYERQVRSI